MKVKISVTIDEELREKMDKDLDFKTGSELVNHVLLKYFDARKDLFYKIKDMDFQINKKKEERRKLIDQLKITVDEGNKEEREKALKELEEQKKFEEQKGKKFKDIMKNFLEVVELFKLKEWMQSCKTYEDFRALILEMGKINFNQHHNTYSIPYPYMTAIFERLNEKTDKEVVNQK